MVGEPYAGKPHVRFDEGVLETRGSPWRACALLYGGGPPWLIRRGFRLPGKENFRPPQLGLGASGNSCS